VSRKVIFEVCAETLQACTAAREGGADRIELCSALSEDGLTASHGLIRAAVEQTGLPIHVLIRPRAGDFVYTNEEFSLMREDIIHARDLHASGVVIGILNSDSTVDIERTRQLVHLAGEMEVTFHRAFDLTLNLHAALEAVIATGCHRLLTSGGEPDVIAGTACLAQLVDLAADRIQVAAGGGVRVGNAALLVAATRVPHLHGSLRRKIERTQKNVLASARNAYVVDSQDVQAMMNSLNKRDI